MSAHHQQLVTIRQAFHAVDRDHVGCIDAAGVRQLMETLGVTVSDKDLNDAVRALDADGDGLVTEDDIVNALANLTFGDQPATNVNTSHDFDDDNDLQETEYSSVTASPRPLSSTDADAVALNRAKSTIKMYERELADAEHRMEALETQLDALKKKDKQQDDSRVRQLQYDRETIASLESTVKELKMKLSNESAASRVKEEELRSRISVLTDQLLKSHLRSDSVGGDSATDISVRTKEPATVLMSKSTEQDGLSTIKPSHTETVAHNNSSLLSKLEELQKENEALIQRMQDIEQRNSVAEAEWSALARDQLELQQLRATIAEDRAQLESQWQIFGREKESFEKARRRLSTDSRTHVARSLADEMASLDTNSSSSSRPTSTNQEKEHDRDDRSTPAAAAQENDALRNAFDALQKRHDNLRREHARMIRRVHAVEELNLSLSSNMEKISEHWMLSQQDKKMQTPKKQETRGLLARLFRLDQHHQAQEVESVQSTGHTALDIAALSDQFSYTSSSVSRPKTRPSMP